jgi:hypothetical protein
MYVGNVLALLGLALLIDSLEAMALFFICASLQVWRTTYEEKLLEANFTEYAQYRSSVGRFIPRLSSIRERSKLPGRSPPPCLDFAINPSCRRGFPVTH